MTNGSNTNNKDLDKELNDLVTRIRKRVAYHILAEDLIEVLDEMYKDKEITRDKADKLTGRILALARSRGYI